MRAGGRVFADYDRTISNDLDGNRKKTNLNLESIILHNPLSDLGCFPNNEPNTSTRSSERLHPNLRPTSIKSLLSQIDRFRQSLHEGQRRRSSDDEVLEEGEKSFERGSLE